MSATVVHVERTEEELFGIEDGGLGREWLAGVVSEGGVIEHERRANKRDVLATRANRRRLHAGGRETPDDGEGQVI
jgi:hypothetical protein